MWRGGRGKYIATTCLEERTKGETHEKEIMGETNVETLFYHLKKQKSSDFKKFPYGGKTCSLYAAQVSVPLGDLSGSDGPLAFV